MRTVEYSSYLVATTAVLLLASSGPAADPPMGSGGNLPGVKSPFGLGGDPTLVLVGRGDRAQYGRYDADGNFIPDPQHGSLPNREVRGGMITRVGARTGEHRSGRLILGTRVMGSGVFVPEIGSKVLDIKKDFNIEKPDRIVYNLQESVPAFWTEERKKKFPQGLPNDPEPPPAGVPPGWKLVPFREANSDKRDPWQVRVIGEIAEFGHLDAQGEFIPDYSLPIVSRNGILGAVRKDPTDLHRPWRYYTVPFDGAWGRTEVDKEEVYEFRSGRLIKGTLQKTGNFVPELGSTILDFKDYDPHSRRRIYNLPGVLRRAEPK
jgi:hypothetical protein